MAKRPFSSVMPTPSVSNIRASDQTAVARTPKVPAELASMSGMTEPAGWVPPHISGLGESHPRTEFLTGVKKLIRSFLDPIPV